MQHNRQKLSLSDKTAFNTPYFIVLHHAKKNDSPSLTLLFILFVSPSIVLTTPFVTAWLCYVEPLPILE